MTRQNKVSIWFGMVFALAVSLPSAGDSMPATLTTQLPGVDKSYPTWVSAAVATRPDGSLDTALFHPFWLEMIQAQLSVPHNPELGCIPAGEVFLSWVAPPDMTTLEKAFAASAQTLRVKITDRDFGFDRGVPGQLFKAEVLESYKGVANNTSYYFFVPVGRVKVGRQEICKTDYRFKVVPQPGDEAILLIHTVAPGDPYLDLAFEDGLIVLRGAEAFFSGARGLKVDTASAPRVDILAELAVLAKEGGN